MQWLTETIITLTPLSLGVIILGAMALGWIIYGLRGYKYWFKRFHHYKVPRKSKLRKNYGYVEYVPEVVNVSPRPIAREPQIIYKQQAQQIQQVPQVQAPVNIPQETPEPIYSTKDDLSVIEGIGPKIEEILNSYGIYTWRELAMTPISNLKNILEKSGKKFQMHDPSTWPEQAKMADQGKWDELRKWQDALHGGVQVKKA